MTNAVHDRGAATWLPRPTALTIGAACLAAAIVSLACALASGFSGCVYLVLYAVTTLPGLPIGFALFGRRHAAGWISGGLVGYALSAVALWLPAQSNLSGWLAVITIWGIVAALPWLLLRKHVSPVVTLPRWTRRDTLALVLVLLAVPALTWKPFTNIGVLDEAGNRKYRAYFTADFLWHVALTAELGRMQSPPRNPYLARRPLHYYWAYFVVPATISRAKLLPSIQAHLTINALCAGLLFVSAIFVFAWCAVPRAVPVAIATLLALLAASAEGLHVLFLFWRQGQPLEGLRHLNIDAITSWFLRGLTIDGLPRSLWYTPQHAGACALALGALVVPGQVPGRRPLAGVLAGLLLGAALIFSPFIGGAFCLVYGLTAIWVAVRGGKVLDTLSSTTPAVIPVAAALGWCIASGTFEGAGSAVAFGISRLAAAAPFMVPALALGPLLAVAIPAVFMRCPQFRLEPAVVGLLIGFAMFYFVTLTTEPIWIGWRAGQILLVTLPALAAATLAVLVERGLRTVAVLLTVLCFAAGFPTTLIDAHNAQDVDNTEMGAGFRWTVVVPPDTQAAVVWIRNNTAQDAIVQMSIGPRGRETWTLIPTFAERRMAAGQPISLLRMPEYDERSAQADSMYRTTDPAEAGRIARMLRIDYVYVDRVERQAFGEAAISKFGDSQYFNEVFRNGSAVVYAVR